MFLTPADLILFGSTPEAARKEKALNTYISGLYAKVVDAAAEGNTSYVDESPVTTFPWDMWTDEPAPLGAVATFPWVEPEVQTAIKDTFPGADVTYDEVTGLSIDWTGPPPDGPQDF
jgi:hypothetical protein